MLKRAHAFNTKQVKNYTAATHETDTKTTMSTTRFRHKTQCYFHEKTYKLNSTTKTTLLPKLLFNNKNDIKAMRTF